MTEPPTIEPHSSEPLDTEPSGNSKAKTLLKRFGLAGFLFFFIKGLLWLLVPLAIALGWFGK